MSNQGEVVTEDVVAKLLWPVVEILAASVLLLPVSIAFDLPNIGSGGAKRGSGILGGEGVEFLGLGVPVLFLLR